MFNLFIILYFFFNILFKKNFFSKQTFPFEFQKNENEKMKTTGFLLLIFFISGVFWPLEALPYYVRWFSRSMPFTVPGEAFRTVLIRKGAPLTYIYPGILMSYVWLFVFVSLSYWSVKRKKYD